MKHYLGAIIVIWCVLGATLASAKNLGTVGVVYPIAETDFLQWIQTRLQEKLQSGEWQRWQQARTQNVLQLVDRPQPVSELTPAQENKSWLYDPTITLQHDIFDAQGRVQFPAGTRFNPLETLIWTKVLLLYNGDDPKQVEWAKKTAEHYHGKVLFILTQGSLSDQRQQLKQPVYFDQGGQLVHRFSIVHMPASVFQEGKQLRVTEIKR